MGADGLWVRTAHTALSGGLTLGLFLHRTDLQKEAERGAVLQPALFVALLGCSVLLYFRVSLMDPGFVRADEEAEADKNEEQCMVIPQVSSSVKMRRCGYCMVKQPMRAKHCQLCQHCVRRYDHHCPWIENCVGEKNHPLFIVYLSVQLVVLLWGAHVAWFHLNYQPTGLNVLKKSSPEKKEKITKQLQGHKQANHYIQLVEEDVYRIYTLMNYCRETT
ncbi:palmitoyltransferase ZDHHC12 isoform X3 [Lagopus muta]|uniref:palmitoyltransferase ZDHHC12 isoform X3 n=1 Tax=Lagopus muta TaxID=64668 RepID=UPI00209CA87B|nr:palmitoyltransferase ZDHHC12 isoform X3 [Lagopus muta]